ncbi:multiple epidermal growth factor-like domains protein 10 [Gigantopelta aegis]|uniref:multiple epidermal growth factor-like domains protein 10 n=1 Tax=Gigantopelta aegis TaxID=1735272 RepID=UPI001B88C149|nr:multiple epidermal growth factor-like domains protein 10 [Gigantopelta aegis]
MAWILFLSSGQTSSKSVACQEGHNYGKKCTKLCTERHCVNQSASCNVRNGRCAGGCEAGWKGKDCTKTCEEGKNYGPNCRKLCTKRHCMNQSISCDVQNGSCIGGCEAGFKGKDCTKKCEYNVTYGTNCNKSCTERNCLSSSACPRKTGRCKAKECQPGWNGTDCTQACLQNVTYGFNCNKLCEKRHCANHMTTCDIETGECGTGGCKPGWKGDDCTQACLQNVTYGSNCNKLCEKRQCTNHLAACDIEAGECGTGGCEPGWDGDDCTEACLQNVTYGSNCSKLCEKRQCANHSTTCDIETGECGTGGCQPGWKGEDCTQVCGSPRYGSSCLYRCSARHCNGNSSCNHISGACDNGCQHGWEGIACTECEQNVSYGRYNCKKVCADRHCADSSSSCDVKTGACVGGCQAGWSGTECKRACIQNDTYGHGCIKYCKERHCLSSNTPCNLLTGDCGGDGCQAGWQGVDCAQACEQGVKYGLHCNKSCADRHCDPKNTSCTTHNGTCFGGCLPGWMGHDCTQGTGHYT